MNSFLMTDREFVDDGLVEEGFVGVHHWNYSLSCHRVEVPSASFLSVELSFVEKNQAKTNIFVEQLSENWLE